MYISCTDEVGVKIRGGREMLEVKVRLATSKCGAEYWEKIEHCHMDHSRSLKDAIMGKLQSLSISERTHQAALMRACEQLKHGGDLKLYTLQKTRKCDHFKGVDVEQTDIELVLDDSRPSPGAMKDQVDHCMEGSVKKEQVHTHWRSIAFEQRTPVQKEPSAITTLLSQLGVGGDNLVPSAYQRLSPTVMGYPGFVLHLKT